MKIEVRCPSCGRGYLVDEPTDLRELLCPSCSSPFSLDAVPGAPPAGQTEATKLPRAAAAGSGSAGATPAAGSRAWVDGEETIVCPRCKLHFSPRSSSEAPEPEGQRGMPRVLVVEDMEYFREIAQEALAETYDVRTAATVDEARAALAAGDIDLMVLDLTLDGGDHGIDLLRSLPSKPCPILIYTAQDESEMYGDSWEELRGLGADDMVMKGISVGESLVRKVGALLGRAEHDDEDLVANTVTSRE